MENTYQDLITDIQSKNPKIGGKLEGGKKIKIKSDYKTAGDQPEAIKSLVKGAKQNEFNQVLLGVTGSGKTFTMAKVIEETNRPALILAPNKTLATIRTSSLSRRDLVAECVIRSICSLIDASFSIYVSDLGT